ncbi:MAG TPA: ATP synthase F1 subunit gamma [Elusimicrobia bacterium]|nr:ATP synthase F1 subunit gamma [Elusimicrobiota bacterium]
MASIRDIRKHIGSVKSIKQITYAMKMVAAARIKRAQFGILSARPFSDKMDALVGDLYSEMGEEDFKASPAYKLFEEKTMAGAVCLVLVTADKGLCGSFNTNLLKAALAWLKEYRGKKIYVIAVGRKGRDFLKRLKGLDLELHFEMVNIFPRADYAKAEILGGKVIELFLGGNIERVTLIYNEFKSMLTQRIVTGDLLPLQKRVLSSGIEVKRGDFNFEPSKAGLLEALLPRQLKAQLYRVLLESQAAELAARMNAMESASKNAAELIEGLTLKMNKTRQAMITTELNEIVGGAEALGG